MKITSPNGKPIRGTLEKLSGVALISGITNGEPDYTGDTDVWWDGQATVYRKNERVFVDTNGDEFLQSQLIISNDT